MSNPTSRTVDQNSLAFGEIRRVDQYVSCDEPHLWESRGGDRVLDSLET